MPTYSAISSNPRSVVFVVFEGTKLLDVAGPLQVFTDARSPDGTPAYAINVVSEMGGPVSTDTVCQISSVSFANCGAKQWDTVLISGGDKAYEAARSKPILAYLATVSRDTRRLGSICLGAFVLAAGGYLSGRKAVTHWDGCAALATQFPDVDVRDDAIFVEDRGVWSSAGVTAGIDMALEMVKRDLGASEALRIAKSLVLPVQRSGGQRQFSASLAAQVAHRESRFDALLRSVAANLQDRHGVADMAAQAGMSERNFSRQFTADLGISPAQYVEHLRVDRAATLLHQPDISLTAAQLEAGFSNAEHMRRAFQRRLGVSPSAYAAKFARRA